MQTKIHLGAEARKECLGKKAGTCWSDEELDSLWLGVRLYGQGEWTTMLADPKLKFSKEKVAEDLSKRWKREMCRIFKKEDVPAAVSSRSRKVVPGVCEAGRPTSIPDHPDTNRMGFAGCSSPPGIQVGPRAVDYSPRFQMGNASSPYWFPVPMPAPGPIPVLPTGVVNARAQMFGGLMAILPSGMANTRTPAAFPFPNADGMQTFAGPMSDCGGSNWAQTILLQTPIFPVGMGTEAFPAGPPFLPTGAPPMPVFPGGEGGCSRRKTFPSPMPVSAVLPSEESYRRTPTGLLLVHPNTSSQPNTASSRQDASKQELFLGGAFKLKEPPFNQNQGCGSSETSYLAS